MDEPKNIIGFTAHCINNSETPKELTLGKGYKIHGYGPYAVCIMNDKNELRSYSRTNFTIEEVKDK